MQLTVQSHIEQTVIEQTLQDCFQLQRKSFHQQGIETIAQRKQHLLNLKALINNHREAIIDSLNRDYSSGPKYKNDMSIIACILVQKTV